MKNYDRVVSKGKKKAKNINDLAPQWPFRLLLCGGSGCGKTNTLVNMLLENFLYYDRIYLYAKNLNQDKYQYLMRTIKKRAAKMGVDASGLIFVSSRLEDVIVLEDPEKKDDKGKAKAEDKATTAMKKLALSKGEMPKTAHTLDASVQNLVIFDDFVTEKNQDIISNYFIGSRHHNCSCIYLSQSYFDTPKVIRLNCTHFGLWEVNGKELDQIARDHCGSVDKETFHEMFRVATQHEFHFLFIDKTTRDRRLRFRQNFGNVGFGEKEESIEAESDSSDSDNSSSSSGAD